MYAYVWMHMYACTYRYTYIYTYTHMCVCNIYIYIYIYREREREREREMREILYIRTYSYTHIRIASPCSLGVSSLVWSLFWGTIGKKCKFETNKFLDLHMPHRRAKPKGRHHLSRPKSRQLAADCLICFKGPTQTESLPLP